MKDRAVKSLTFLLTLGITVAFAGSAAAATVSNLTVVDQTDGDLVLDTGDVVRFKADVTGTNVSKVNMTSNAVDTQMNYDNSTDEAYYDYTVQNASTFNVGEYLVNVTTTNGSVSTSVFPRRFVTSDNLVGVFPNRRSFVDVENSSNDVNVSSSQVTPTGQNPTYTTTSFQSDNFYRLRYTLPSNSGPNPNITVVNAETGEAITTYASTGSPISRYMDKEESPFPDSTTEVNATEISLKFELNTNHTLKGFVLYGEPYTDSYNITKLRDVPGEQSFDYLSHGDSGNITIENNTVTADNNQSIYVTEQVRADKFDRIELDTSDSVTVKILDAQSESQTVLKNTTVSGMSTVNISDVNTTGIQIRIEMNNGTEINDLKIYGDMYDGGFFGGGNPITGGFIGNALSGLTAGVNTVVSGVLNVPAQIFEGILEVIPSL